MGVRALSAVPTTVARAVDPDVGLVAAAREEPRAFLALYDRYSERVLGYARVRIRDAATCEDVTSQIFTMALAQIGRFRGEGSFAGWLFQIARNAVLDVQRRPAPEPLSDQAAVVADADPGPEERLLALERAERLHRLVGELQPEQQHLLSMRYGAGLAYDEIGGIVGACGVPKLASRLKSVISRDAHRVFAPHKSGRHTRTPTPSASSVRCAPSVSTGC